MASGASSRSGEYRARPRVSSADCNARARIGPLACRAGPLGLVVPSARAGPVELQCATRAGRTHLARGPGLARGMPSARVSAPRLTIGARVSARGLRVPGLARAGPYRAASGRRLCHRRGYRRAVVVLASGHMAPISAAVGPVPGLRAAAVGLGSAAGGRASGRARDQRRRQFRRFNSYVCYRGSRFAIYQLRFGRQVFAMCHRAVLIISILQNHNLIFAKSTSRFARRVERGDGTRCGLAAKQ